MQKLANAIEEIGRYVEALEKQAQKAAAPPYKPSVVEPAIDSNPQRDYGELLPKLAARLDKEEDAVKAELDKLDGSVLGELAKLADDDGSASSVSLGSASDYVDHSTKSRRKEANTSRGAWDNFTKYLLDKP